MPSVSTKSGSSKRKHTATTNSDLNTSTSSATTTPKNVELTEKALADSTTSTDGHPVHEVTKKWNVGDKVLCRYMNAENIYYEAKIMSLKTKEGETAYAVHYPVYFLTFSWRDGGGLIRELLVLLFPVSYFFFIF